MGNECVIEKLGNCCCQCKFNIPIMKHPINMDIGKGNMSEQMGYACIGFLSLNERIAHFFDKQHGLCELFIQQDNEK